MNDTIHESVTETETEVRPLFLEGMKVLFDDRVGLYPVNLVETPNLGNGQNGESDVR